MKRGRIYETILQLINYKTSDSEWDYTVQNDNYEVMLGIQNRVDWNHAMGSMKCCVHILRVLHKKIQFTVSHLWFPYVLNIEIIFYFWYTYKYIYNILLRWIPIGSYYFP